MALGGGIVVGRCGIFGLVSREVEEHVVEAGFSDRESGEGDVRRVDATECVRGRRGTPVDREFSDGAVEVRGLGGDVADQFDAAPRVGGVEEREHEHGVTQAGLQLLAGPLGDDLAVVEHDELFGETVGLFEVLGREEDRRSLLDQFFNDRPKVLATLGVQSGRGFIQEEQRRLGDEGRREVESSAHAP